MKDKLKALIHSRRFWVSVSGVVIVVANGLGLDIGDETVTNLVMMLGAWVLGDSLNTTKLE